MGASILTKENVISWIGGGITGILLGWLAEWLSSLFSLYFWLIADLLFVSIFVIFKYKLKFNIPTFVSKFASIASFTLFLILLVVSFSPYFSQNYVVHVTYVKSPLKDSDVEVRMNHGNPIHGKTNSDGFFYFSVNNYVRKPDKVLVQCPGYQSSISDITATTTEVEMKSHIGDISFVKPKKIIFHGDYDDFKLVAKLMTEGGKSVNINLGQTPLSISLDSESFPINACNPLVSSIQGEIDHGIKVGEHEFIVSTATTTVGTYKFKVAAKYIFQENCNNSLQVNSNKNVKIRNGFLNIYSDEKFSNFAAKLKEKFITSKQQGFKLRYTYRHSDAILTLGIGNIICITIGKIPSAMIQLNQNFPAVSTCLELRYFNKNNRMPVIKTIPLDGDIAINKDVEIAVEYDPTSQNGNAKLNFMISYFPLGKNSPPNKRTDNFELPIFDPSIPDNCEVSIGCVVPKQKRSIPAISIKEIDFGI